jgi:hypothetical protein
LTSAFGSNFFLIFSSSSFESDEDELDEEVVELLSSKEDEPDEVLEEEVDWFSVFTFNCILNACKNLTIKV